jgi:putative ABC transport system permease protein
VQSAYPLYLEYYLSKWKNPDSVPPDNSPLRPIRVLAFDPAHRLLRFPEVDAQLDKLRLPNTALVDQESRREYGQLTTGIERELAGRKIRMVGTFRLGTDFTTNGNAIVSDVTFAGLFPDRAGVGGSNPLRAVDLGIIKLDANADPATVKSALQTALPGDVAVFTLNEFVEQEMDFWGNTTPVGFVFGLGMVMGFTIGAVICYQILSADVGDHLAEYATLKAIGYRNRYLSWVIFQEALLLSVLGFLPGLALSWLLYLGVASWTGLPMHLTLMRSLWILVLTLLMNVLSGVVALTRVQSADPAEVF